LELIPLAYDRVVAWSVGTRSTAKDLGQIRQSVRECGESDLRLNRPTVAEAASDWLSIGNEVDILNVGVRMIGSSFIASGYSDWIFECRQAFFGAKPIWADVQTQLSNDVQRQVLSLIPNMPPIPVDPQQLKFVVHEAISGGARGLRFLSNSRLDAADPPTQLRALTLRWLLLHVGQIEPWAKGGTLMGEVRQNDPDVEVTALQTDRSRLLLVSRPTHSEQYWAGDPPLKTISLEDPSAGFTDRAYSLSEISLKPLNLTRRPAGTAVNLENCPSLAAVLLTQDPLIIKQVSQWSTAPTGESTVFDLHLKISRQWLAILQLIDEQLGRIERRVPAASAALNEASLALRQAGEFHSRGSGMISLNHLEQADQRMALARREILTNPLGKFTSKTSSPLLTHVSLVPIHLRLSEHLSQSQWKPNSLPGGDFEDLDHMTSHGWTNRRGDCDDFATSVELSKAAAVDGHYGMLMSVRPVGKPRLIQSAPIWITTSPVPVSTGQLMRIHGWVKIPTTITGGRDGFMITDSLGGDDLAERISWTDGWQEFTLYRVVPDDGTVEVTFALNGFGQAMIDEVTIRAIDVPPLMAPRQANAN
jgi:hypothetical protein